MLNLSAPMMNNDFSVMTDKHGKDVSRRKFLSSRPIFPECKEKADKTGRTNVYLLEDAIIRNMNAVFGNDGWSTEVVKEREMECKQNENGCWVVSYIINLRLSLRDGTKHEDYGSGEAANYSKYLAHEFALKSALENAMRRAARYFGERLGNALMRGASLEHVPLSNKNSFEQLEKCASYENISRSDSKAKMNNLASKAENSTTPQSINEWEDFGIKSKSSLVDDKSEKKHQKNDSFGISHFDSKNYTVNSKSNSFSFDEFDEKSVHKREVWQNFDDLLVEKDENQKEFDKDTHLRTKIDQRKSEKKHKNRNRCMTSEYNVESSIPTQKHPKECRSVEDHDGDAYKDDNKSETVLQKQIEISGCTNSNFSPRSYEKQNANLREASDENFVNLRKPEVNSFKTTDFVRGKVSDDNLNGVHEKKIKKNTEERMIEPPSELDADVNIIFPNNSEEELRSSRKAVQLMDKIDRMFDDPEYSTEVTSPPKSIDEKEEYRKQMFSNNAGFSDEMAGKVKENDTKEVFQVLHFDEKLEGRKGYTIENALEKQKLQNKGNTSSLARLMKLDNFNVEMSSSQDTDPLSDDDTISSGKSISDPSFPPIVNKLKRNVNKLSLKKGLQVLSPKNFFKSKTLNEHSTVDKKDDIVREERTQVIENDKNIKLLAPPSINDHNQPMLSPPFTRRTSTSRSPRGRSPRGRSPRCQSPSSSLSLDTTPSTTTGRRFQALRFGVPDSPILLRTPSFKSTKPRRQSFDRSRSPSPRVRTPKSAMRRLGSPLGRSTSNFARMVSESLKTCRSPRRLE